MAFGGTVQSVDATFSGEATINFSAATAGNLLIIMESRGTPHSAGGAWGAPAGWNIIHDSGVNTGNMGAAFYWKIATGGETSFTTSHTNESGVGQIAFAEFEGPFAASPLDVVAEDATHLATVVTSQSTGTTGTTAQNDELAIAAFAADSQSTVDGGGTRNYSNSFTEVIFTDVQTARASAMIAKKILSATGTVECTFSVTDTGDEMYGSVATFKKQVSGGATDLTVQDASHTHASDSIALTVNAQLAITEPSHIHASDAIALVTDNFLAAQDATHTHATEGIALTVTAILSISDVTHEHATDGIALTAQSSLSVVDSSHEHVSDAITLTIESYLAITDATHEHIADSISLTTEGSSNLSVDDATHDHVTDSIALAANSFLVAQDATHEHSTDVITIIPLIYLVVTDSAHVHSVDAIAFVSNSYLVVNDATHIHVSDSIVLGGDLPVVDAHYTYIIPAENRVYVIPAVTEETSADRTFTIPVESRIYQVPHD